MSKRSGLGCAFYLGGHDISGDIQALDQVSVPSNLLDMTDITESAYERVRGRRDGTLAATTFFNAATGRAHPVLSALPTSDVIASFWVGKTVGNPVAVCNGKQVGYDPTRSDAGDLTLKTQIQANGYGLEWGVQLTAGTQTDTEATDSDALDQGAQTTNGAQAYLHVFSVTGTSCTVTIQDSADDSTFASLIAFTAATGATAERKTVTGTVDRYVRVSTSGTFTSCSFAVIFVRNQKAVTF